MGIGKRMLAAHGTNPLSPSLVFMPKVGTNGGILLC